MVEDHGLDNLKEASILGSLKVVLGHGRDSSLEVALLDSLKVVAILGNSLVVESLGSFVVGCSLIRLLQQSSWSLRTDPKSPVASHKSCSVVDICQWQ